ncbi:BLUF domain-containing protein [Roseomonas stagni]|uniref:BLUF domain-containing protein n=1 Tax=Falsiroseomonas algicola TaxID=2716930 RepID=A0A6M1LN98_9PROT|nr:BLUF domain-containing protein [Falsiroseomonas algicola]NGM21687.1 BLUF domain-containing protein [Falsiroseomonas algicola]
MTLHRIVAMSIGESGVAADPAAIAAMADRLRGGLLARGVTGCLTLRGHCIGQVLEGPPRAVRNAFARLKRDWRHRDLVVLEDRAVAAREFSDWGMRPPSA